MFSLHLLHSTRKRFATVVAMTLLSAVAPAAAHDFWLEPETFNVTKGNPVDVRFMIGHADNREHWALKWERVVALATHGPSGFSDRLAAIRPMFGDEKGGARIEFQEEGTHVLAFESRQSFIELEAERFNGHVKKEGLSLIANDRKARGTEDQPGTEVYGRRAKLLIQVGETTTENAIRPVGQTLEIVPEKNPYALKDDEPLPVRVFFRGKPLEGATIDLQNLTLGVLPVTETKTDVEGRAVFDFAKVGVWKVNVIWATPQDNHAAAAYDTVFSSLTFGFR